MILKNWVSPILLGISLTFSSLGFSREMLPPEIDYISAKENYDHQRELSEKIKTEKENLEGQIDQTQSALRQNRDRVSLLERELRQANDEIEQLDRDNRRREDRIERERQTISQRENQIGNHQRDMRRLDLELSPIRRERDNLQSALNQQRRRLEQVRSEQRQKENQVNQLKQRKETFEGNLTRVQNQLRQLNQQRQETRANLDSKQAEVAQVKQTLEQVENRKSNLEQRVKNLRQRLQDANNDQQRERISASLEEAQDNLNNVNQRFQRLTRQVTNLEREVQNLRENLSRIRNSIAQNQQRRDNISSQIQTVNRNIQTEERELSQINSSVRTLQRSVDQQQNNLNRVLSRVQSLERQRSQHENHVRSLSRDNDQSRRFITDEQRVIVNQQRRVSNLLSQIPQTQSEISRLTVEIENRRVDLARQQERLLGVSNQLDQAIRLTERAFGIYQEKKTLYQQYENQAEDLGRRSALSLAASQGDALAEEEHYRDARENALNMGELRGNLHGRLNGLEDGRDDGDREGLRDGLASEDDYQEGFNRGLEAGKQEAIEQANREVLPHHYRRVFNQTLNQAERQELQTGQNPSHSLDFGLLEGQSSSRLIVKQGFDLDDLITRVQSDVERYRSPRFNLSQAQYSYSQPQEISIDRSDNDCHQVYKELRVFRETCLREYDHAFVEEFTDSYRRTYFDFYDDIYKTYYQQTFDRFKNNLFEESYDQAYKSAYNRSLLIGRDQTRSEGFEIGFNQGYEEKWPSAQSEARELAEIMVKKFFAENGVLRLDKSSSQGAIISSGGRTQFSQGSQFSLGLRVRNLGKKPSIRGTVNARARVVQGDARINGASQIALPSVGASRSASLSQLFQITIPQTARPGQRFRVRIDLDYPGDDFQSSHSEMVEFSGTVLENPDFETRIRVDLTPPMRQLFSYPRHNITVSLTGKYSNVAGGYRVELAPQTQSDANQIDFENSQFTVSSLARGETKEGVLSYRFNRNAQRGRTVRLVVRYFYNNRFLKDATLEITPR